MGCRILYDPMNGSCFFDSVTESCFGPLMKDDDEAEAFMEYLMERPTFIRGRSSSDPRAYVDSLLRHHFDEFRRVLNEAEKAEAVDVEEASRALLREFARDGHVQLQR